MVSHIGANLIIERVVASEIVKIVNLRLWVSLAEKVSCWEDIETFPNTYFNILASNRTVG